MLASEDTEHFFLPLKRDWVFLGVTKHIFLVGKGVEAESGRG